MQRVPLVEQVIQALRERIAAGTYPVGSRLPPEPQLMTDLGIGRSTLREAVRVLSHGGLLEVRQGDGTYVRAVDEGDPLARRLRLARAAEANEVRQLLELETARLAALRRTPEHLARLREHLARREACREAGDVDGYLDADLAFHLGIAAASGNEFLADLYRSFAAALRPTLSEVATLADAQSELHAQLLQAIERGKPEQARALTGQLLGAIEASLSPTRENG